MYFKGCNVGFFFDKTVENNVQLLPLASTVSSCATVAMTIVTLRLGVNVQCQVQSNLFFKVSTYLL